MTKKTIKKKQKENVAKENEPKKKMLDVLTTMKKTLKRKQKEDVATEDEPKKKLSDEPATKKVKWTNRQRVLVFATRGINHRHRHLMEDLKKLMPHHRPECKMERTKNLQVVNEMCEMKNCNKAILFEGRMKRDLYMWLANVPTGPSAKFLVENSKDWKVIRCDKVTTRITFFNNCNLTNSYL